MIGIASQLGTPGVTCRVLSGQAHPGVAAEQGLDWSTEAIERLIPIAREQGVTLVIENHDKAGSCRYPEFAQRKEVLLRLQERIPERVWFGMQFDPSNAITAGADPADSLESVIERTVSMQASDRFLLPGTTLDSLRQADGMAEMRESAEFLQEARDRWFHGSHVISVRAHEAARPTSEGGQRG